MNELDFNVKKYQLIDEKQKSFENFGVIYGLKHSSKKNLVTVIECKFEHAVEEERNILEKLQTNKSLPSGILKYHGHSTVVEANNNKVYYLFFEYMPISLTQLLEINRKLGQCDFDLVFLIFETLLNTFAFLQEIEVPYCNIHPKNIRLSRDQSHVGLINFKLSRADDTDQIYSNQHNQYNYMAPEIFHASQSQIKIMNPDDLFKSDAYSFGLLMMELITAKIIDSRLESLKDTLIEVEKREFPKKYEQKHMILITLLKDFLEIDPKKRLNFREGFLKNVLLDKPEKNNLCILILEYDGSPIFPATFLDPSSICFYFKLISY